MKKLSLFLFLFLFSLLLNNLSFCMNHKRKKHTKTSKKLKKHVSQNPEEARKSSVSLSQEQNKIQKQKSIQEQIDDIYWNRFIKAGMIGFTIGTFIYFMYPLFKLNKSDSLPLHLFEEFITWATHATGVATFAEVSYVYFSRDIIIKPNSKKENIKINVTKQSQKSRKKYSDQTEKRKLNKQKLVSQQKHNRRHNRKHKKFRKNY